MHVRTAEGVDRLLRVADEHQGRVVGAVEEGAEDVPLHRIGVLELVDEGDPEPAAQRLDRGGAAAAVERPSQLDEDVVEAQRARAASARPHQVDRGGDQLDEQPGRVIDAVVAVARREHEVGDVDGVAGRGDQGGVLRQHLARVGDRRGGEHVGAALGGELGRVVDEGGIRVGAGGRAEGAEHLGREPVDRGDRRRVELGDGALQARQALLAVSCRRGARAGRRRSRRGSSCTVRRRGTRRRPRDVPGPWPGARTSRPW